MNIDGSRVCVCVGPCVCQDFACQDVSSFVRWPVLFVNIDGSRVCVTECVCKCIGPLCLSSFGNSLSRCIIFRQVARPVCEY